MDAAFADGEGAHADVLLQHVAVAEQQVLTVQLLQGADREKTHVRQTHRDTRTDRETDRQAYRWIDTCSLSYKRYGRSCVNENRDGNPGKSVLTISHPRQRDQIPR